MCREARKVPSNWKHPKCAGGSYIPLMSGYTVAAAQWERGYEEWESGIYPSDAVEDNKQLSYPEWAGEKPSRENYMPDWPDDSAMFYMMYETTSFGTPKSPAFATQEELAKWLVDNNVSAFAGMTITYDHWMNIIKGQSVCIAVKKRQCNAMESKCRTITDSYFYE